MPVEVVAPCCAAEAGQTHRHQIVEQRAGFILRFLASNTAIVRQSRERKQRNPFCVLFVRHTRERAQVNWRALEELRPGEARGARVFQRRGSKQTAVQAIERIKAGEVAFAAPREEIRKCLLKIGIVH